MGPLLRSDFIVLQTHKEEDGWTEKQQTFRQKYLSPSERTLRGSFKW